MKLRVLFAQRPEKYEGQYGLEALAVMSEADYEANPDYLHDALKEHAATRHFEALAVVALTVSEASIRAVLKPPTPVITATVCEE